MNPFRSRFPPRDQAPVLTFAPLAWLKLLFFCHSSPNEVGGFGISAEHDFLTIEEFHAVRQHVTPVSVRFDDAAVADHFDACVDRGIGPCRAGRVWLHTHPGTSVEPSSTDEETFARVFSGCDWSVMFILGRTGLTHARLSFSAGPGGSLLLPVRVDWPSWPAAVAGQYGPLEAHLEQWRQELTANVEAESRPLLGGPSAHVFAPWEREPWWADWDQELGLLGEENNDHESERNRPDGRPGPAATRARAAGMPN